MKRKAADSGHPLTCYCLRCRSNTEMVKPVRTVKGNVSLTKGQCKACGGGVARVGSAKEGEH